MHTKMIEKLLALCIFLK